MTTYAPHGQSHHGHSQKVRSAQSTLSPLIPSTPLPFNTYPKPLPYSFGSYSRETDKSASNYVSQTPSEQPTELERSFYFVPGQQTRTIDDLSAIRIQNNENRGKMKYILTDFSQFTHASEGSINGLLTGDSKQLFVSSALIDQSSTLRDSDVTTCRQRTNWGDYPLPLATLPAKYQGKYGDPDIESKLQLIHTTNNFKSVDPVDCHVYNRTFGLFGPKECTEVPDPMKSVEDPYFLRGGQFTRRS